MIDILFQFGNEHILVKVEGKKVLFGNTSFGRVLAPIDGLKFSKAGVEKEFPDLRNNPLWKEEAAKRFKNKVRGMRSEDSIAKYVIEDLKSHGYIPLKMQKGGHRPMKL